MTEMRIHLLDNKERMTKVERVINQIKSIADPVYLNGPLSDLAGKIGSIIAEELPPLKLDEFDDAVDKFGDDYKSLVDGFKHGVSLVDGTHE